MSDPRMRAMIGPLFNRLEYDPSMPKDEVIAREVLRVAMAVSGVQMNPKQQYDFIFYILQGMKQDRISVEIEKLGPMTEPMAEPHPARIAKGDRPA